MRAMRIPILATTALMIVAGCAKEPILPRSYRAEVVETAEVPPGGAVKLFLPWVDELKHYTGLCDTDPSPGFTASARVAAAAYHLTSTAPVVVYQFNPIEYAG